MKGRHIALVLFVILGISDFAYGVWKLDEFSMFMGSLLVVVAASVGYKEWKGTGS
jgi:hypothetical protein